MNSQLISYITGNDANQVISTKNSTDSRPFASAHGKTYTFSWCRGAKAISDKNKVFFSSENEAKATGRTLSKLCQK